MAFLLLNMTDHEVSGPFVSIEEVSDIRSSEDMENKSLVTVECTNCDLERGNLMSHLKKLRQVKSPYHFGSLGDYNIRVIKDAFASGDKATLLKMVKAFHIGQICDSCDDPEDIAYKIIEFGINKGEI